MVQPIDLNLMMCNIYSTFASSFSEESDSEGSTHFSDLSWYVRLVLNCRCTLVTVPS